MRLNQDHDWIKREHLAICGYILYNVCNKTKSNPDDMASSLQEPSQPEKAGLLQRGRLSRIVNNLPIVKGSLGSNVGQRQINFSLF